jgi:hypothetical protein
MTGIIGELCITAIALAHIAANHRQRMKNADRERLVNPVKAPPQDAPKDTGGQP